MSQHRRAGGQAGGDPPKTHVGLDQEEVAYAARVGRAGGGLEHVPAILWVEHGGDDAEGAKSKKRKDDSQHSAAV